MAGDLSQLASNLAEVLSPIIRVFRRTRAYGFEVVRDSIKQRSRRASEEGRNNRFAHICVCPKNLMYSELAEQGRHTMVDTAVPLPRRVSQKI